MIPKLDPEKVTAAQARQNSLLKIPGSLGLLEEIGNRIGAMQRTDRPSLGRGAVVVCCADHGVMAESVAAAAAGAAKSEMVEAVEARVIGSLLQPRPMRGSISG